MKNLKLFALLPFFLCYATGFTQVVIDHPVTLTGSGTNARVTGIKSVLDTLDAPNVETVQSGVLISSSSSYGSGNNFQLSITPPLGAYQVGMMLNFISGQSASGPSTLQVNNLSAAPLKKMVTQDLQGCEIIPGQAVTVIYDGTNFQITSAIGAALLAPVATAASAAAQEQITANWNASSAATGYFLDVALDNGFTNFVSGYNNLSVGNVETYNVSGLSCGTTYYYRIRASNGSCTSNSSNTVSSATSSCCISNTWTQETNFGGLPRDFATGFVIGNYGYVGTGYSPSNGYFNDFWQYDPGANAWTQVANYPASVYTCYSFSIGNYGYVGGGAPETTAFYQYDPVANTWTAMAAGPDVSLGFSFSIGNYGYAGGGEFVSGGLSYQYNATNNSWTNIAAYPGSGGAYYSSSFALGGIGYAGAGAGEGGAFYAYNPGTNSWNSITSYPLTGTYGGGGFALGAYGYVASGLGSSGALYQYDPTGNVWNSKTAFGGGNRNVPVALTISGAAYVGTGALDGSNTPSNDFWKYCQ